MRFRNLNLLDPPFLAVVGSSIAPSCPSFTPGTETNPFVGNVTIRNDADVAAFQAGGYDAILGWLVAIDEDGNPGSITSLAGIAGVRYVSDMVDIQYCYALTDLTGLEDLALANGVSVQQCPALTSVSALNSLVETRNNLWIMNNPLLTTVDDAFQCLARVGTDINIQGNGT